MNRVILTAATCLVACQFACERSEPDTLSDRSAAGASQHQQPAELGSSLTPAPVEEGHGSGAIPEPQRSAGGSEAGEGPPSAVQPEQRGEPSWVAPDDWLEKENASSMRLATWTLPTESNEAECAVFRFPGGGDPRANLRRWIGQVVNEEGEPSTDVAEQGQLVVDDTPVFVLKTHGTYVTQDPPMRGPEVRLDDYALLGAVFVLQEPVFVKCVGPRDELAASEASTIGFVRSFTFGTGD